MISSDHPFKHLQLTMKPVNWTSFHLLPALSLNMVVHPKDYTSIKSQEQF